MEKTDIYRKLQRHIDGLPIPFPATESGVELSLLKRLFDPTEARIALALSAVQEPVSKIYSRLKDVELTEDEVRTILDGLVVKGAITGGMGVYGRMPLAVGMFEMQVDHLTPGYVEDFQTYMDEGFRDAVIRQGTGQMRTVPVNLEITVNHPVGTYHDIRAYLASNRGPFAVMNCVCRQGKDVTGGTCRYGDLRETCLTIGGAAIAMKRRGHARIIPREEILDILDRAEQTGLVIQPENTRNPSFICCCCADCCEILVNARKLEKPAEAFENGYQISVDAEACTGCARCIKRCPMEALSMVEKIAVADLDRCIGCGVCAVTCAPGALSLTPIAGASSPPADKTRMFMKIMLERFGPIRTAVKAIRVALGLKI